MTTENQILADSFAEDWLLVMENDHESWSQLIDDVKSLDCEILATTTRLREEWDELVDQMAEAVEEKVSDVGALLLRQILSTGDYPFQIIATHVINSIKEQERHYENA